jgi:protein required for attachment to host cells
MEGPMPHTTTWIIVANSSHATIYRMTKFPKMEQISNFEHPESRLHDIDLVTSRPGRGFESMGTARHAYQQMTDPKQMEIEIFAKSLSEHLDKAHMKGDFSRLYIVASPTFLGLLRKHLDIKTQQCVVAEIAKDMTEHRVADIEQQLANL